MDANPGRWLLWTDNAGGGSMISYLKRLGYEATTRKTGVGLSVYARRPEGWTPS